MGRKTYMELFEKSSYPVLISTPENIFYTIGFSTAARRPGQIGINCVLMTRELNWFFYPANWRLTVEEQLEQEHVVLMPYEGDVRALARRIAEVLPLAAEMAEPADVIELGFEREGMELSLYLSLKEILDQKNCSVKWTNVSDRFRKARLVKSEKEIKALKMSAAVAKGAMEHAKTILRPGLRELDVVAELEYYMRKRGSDGTPFTMKVLTGENAIRIVNLPGDRKIRKGEIVLLDFGATVCHYASDWTRSFAVGKVSREQRHLYDLVWQVERECIQMIRPGVNLRDLMDHAMALVEDDPWAKWFHPYLGHSIGISSQEWPPIKPDSDMFLQENMVITIEPGIYVPGVGGVRIEDEVLVTAGGYEILTGLEKEEFLISRN